jgi:hypothetical protein
MAIFTTIATAIAGALFGGSLLAANLIGGALAFGAKLALSKLNKPKKQTFTAVQGEVQLGGDVSASALFGTGKTKGHRVFYAKWGKGNQGNTDIFALSNGWCDGLEPYVYFYGEKRTLLEQPPRGGETKHYYVEGYGSHISVRFYDGRPGQPVDMGVVTTTAALGKNWKATSRLSGICYVVVERWYSGDLFSKGRPDFEWVLRGLREYDPTKDATVAGGNGPQRLADPSTWVHTKNPALHRLNYQLGLKGFRSGRTIVGEGKSLGQLDLASYFVAINYCRTLRKGKPIYECSLFIDGDTDHTEVLSAFDDAMAGYALNRRGLSGVVVGASQIPVLTLTEDDIPADRPKPRQPRKSSFDLFNHLSGQFTSIETMWNPESLKPIVVNADVAADKRSRQTSIDFLQVSDADIAQYLLNVRYRQNRKGGTMTMPVSRRVGLEVMEGEWIEVSGKDWMISEWQCSAEFEFTLILSETGADIYDDGEIAPGPIVIPSPPVINPSMLSTVQDFNVEAGMISSTGGQDTPCLRFTWSPPADPTITEVRISYRKHGETNELLATCSEPESGVYITTDGVVSETLYNARATITTVPDRLRTHTPWVTTLAPTGRMNILDNSIIASKIATGAIIADKIMAGAVTSLKLADLAVTTAKLQIAAVTSDILANNSVIAAKIANASIGITKFASGIEPVGIIAGTAVPTTKTTEVITVNGKLYRWNGTAYVASVASVDLSGQITSTQITDNAITTPKIATNAVTANEIAANAVTSDKILANSIIAGKIAAGAVAATQIAAAAITADKLAVGTASQWLENTDLSAGLTGWGARSINGSNWEVSMRTDQYGAAPYGSIQVRQNSAGASGNYYDLTPYDPNTGTIKFFAVEPGKNYQASAYGFTNRCQWRVFIGWMDSSGTYLNYPTGPLVGTDTGSPNFALGNYNRSYVFGVAPPTAVKAVFFVRHNSTLSGVDSYAWFTHMFFGEATANQTDPSPWSQAGVTLIDAGNIVTGAVTTAKLDALAVTTAKLAVGAVTAGTIAANAVTAVAIAASTITGAKIAADTIGVNNLAANSVTAKSMIITDYENLVPNGYFAEPGIAGIATYWTVTSGNAYTVSGLSVTGDSSLNLQKAALGSSTSLTLKDEYAIPVTGGEQLYAETANMTNVTAAGAGFYYRINFYTAAMSLISYVDAVGNAPISNVMTTRSSSFAVPATARFAKIQLINHSTNTTSINLIIDRLILRRKKAGSLIVDGSITADHIAVNSLSAISANLGSVNISNAIIGTLTVGTSNIAAGAVTAASENTLAGGSWSGGNRDVSVTVSHGADSPNVVVFGSGGATANTATTTGMNCTLNVLAGAAVLNSVPLFALNNCTNGGTVFGFFRPAAGTTSTTFSCRLSASGVGAAMNQNVFVLVCKR